ncbi:MAG: DNA-binding protein [Sulfolobaceae archaeon]|nr:DNA-binding protein [Sulfolobaceae archaeon]
MEEQIVFDTGAFLAGLQNSYEKVYTTQEVIDEVKDFKSIELLSFGLESNKIIILQPSSQSLNIVKKEAQMIREFGLSKTDISVASLALDLKPSIVLTDDLPLQNLLLHLGIKYIPVKLSIKISKRKSFIYKCEGCGREYDKLYPSCPYCGHKLKKKIKY